MPDDKKSIASVENGVGKNYNKSKLLTKESRECEGDGEIEGVTGSKSGGNSVKLPTYVLNKLYHSYSIKQRRGGLKWFLVASILFNIWSLIIPQEQGLNALIVTLVVLCVYIVICVLLQLSSIFLQPNSLNSCQKNYKSFLNYAPHLLWATCIAHFVLYIILQKSISPRDVLGWAILLNFLIYVTLPVQLFYTGSVIGFTNFVIYVVTVFATSRDDPMFFEQILANVVLILTAAVIGLLYNFMGEAKQKRAFWETKKSLEVKMIIEEQSAEQERLLLSVLPKHVAVKMRQDLGSTSSEPFKKIYMSRHENVSILYADIVGFTAISSTYSAQDLVKMLNELFARFDRLAEKYQQLRIKILGDCYYCISGAPEESSDHAVLCVHMGLSMVKAIKYVQQKTNSPVDMRVGIHTGAVLAGILGQRQWQFDVYSKDVELANKMESSGKAGRVHISDKTLAFLNGEFEVEPAYGERREEALRIAGLKTYFITRVIKPFASPGAKKTNEPRNDNNEQDTLDEELLGQANDDKVQEREDEENINDNFDKQENFKYRLREELVARDGHENLSKDTNIFLKFKNKSLESTYAAYREPNSSVPLIAALLVQCVDILYSYIILPRSPLHFINISAPLVPISMLVFISVAESFPSSVPESFANVSKRFNDIIFVRELAAIIIAITIGLSNVVDMYFFVTFLKTEHIVSEAEFNFTTEGYLGTEPVYTATQGDAVMYPSYMSNFAVLILISIAVISQLTHLTKIVLMAIIAVLHCYFNVFVMSDLYFIEDQLSSSPVISTSFCTSGILILAAMALSLFTRHMDCEDRVMFKWKIEVADQKEMAKDMRRRNEALVYNVLPVHVAEHFMKNTKRSHDDLYSQSYAEVGVLFASMPNFSDFYSEETVNNQGLECLRFLNEVISDFDALLELPQFQDIIKIKTIGSTYMAASGINVNRNTKAGDPITKRFAHLAVLVEFALELKHALQGINEQSFNHFVLKMGINHGPITAGVIGARKPHYDIWGNTVNVASRMESTGKAGAIQVTEETCNILEEFGYTFQQRGLVSVKGKGQLMTYYLQGKSDRKDEEFSCQSKRNVAPCETISKSLELSQLGKISEYLENEQQENIGLTNLPTTERCTKQEESEADIKTPLLNIKTNGNPISDSTNCNESENDSLIN